MGSGTSFFTKSDIFHGDRRHNKKTTIYIFLIIVTTLFIYFYSTSLNKRWIPLPKHLIDSSYFRQSAVDYTTSPEAANITDVNTSTKSTLIIKIIDASGKDDDDDDYEEDSSDAPYDGEESESPESASDAAYGDEELVTEEYSSDAAYDDEESDSEDYSSHDQESSSPSQGTTSTTAKLTEVSSNYTHKVSKTFPKSSIHSKGTPNFFETTLTESESPFTGSETPSTGSEMPSTASEKSFSESEELSTDTEESSPTSTKEGTFTISSTFSIKSKDVMSSTAADEEEEEIDYTELDHENETVEKGFLVYSSQCKIPDLDPMHPSIKELVEISPPINCAKDYEPLTWIDGNQLLLNKTLAKIRGYENLNCSYTFITRFSDGKTDNGIGLGNPWKKMSDNTTIEDDFIVVECTKNDAVFYKNYHTFINDKPDVEKWTSNDNSMYSVLIVGVDSMSRMNMHRQLKKTVAYLLNNMNATEMFGFNKVGDNTFPNLMPLMTGFDERELPDVCWEGNGEFLDDCYYLWNEYSKEGYRTFYAEDTPYISSFNYVKKGFNKQPTDYYLRPFILTFENDMGRNKSLNCHQCVASSSETEVVLKWTEQFAQHFSQKPTFAFSWINSLTHDFLNRGSAGDHFYESFFKNLHQSGALNRTVVIVMGDHGMRWGDIRNTYVGRLEERLPMLLIALPPDFKREHPTEAEALKLNSHRLVTPFDLYATLKHLLFLNDTWNLVSKDNISSELATNYTERSLSLFRPIPANRSCDDAYIDEHWCTCEMSNPVELDDVEVKLVANFIVHQLNVLVSVAKHMCANLTLHNITDARLWQPELEHHKHTTEDHVYTVVVQTVPGDAVFEGTARYTPNQDKIDLLGSVSRLNLYGNQSECVKDAILKKYCFCV